MKITRPTLLLDKKRCIRNIQNMVQKAKEAHVKFRPHFKTHQSYQIGEWFREFGVESITVSSVKMAEYFANHGWQEITIAFPVNVLEAEVIESLAKKITLNIVVVNEESIHYLLKKISTPLNVFIKMDVGTHRTGINPAEEAAINALIQAITATPLLTFKGFLAHAGHSYGCRSKAEVLEVHQSSLAILAQLKNRYLPSFPKIEISIGDTPTCCVASDFGPATEIRPGNFVFFDYMQHQIGTCQLDEIAVVLACPVVAKHADDHKVIVHGGGAQLAKDVIQEGGTACYGKVMNVDKNGIGAMRTNMTMVDLSQEHGIIQCSSDEFDKVSIGDLLYILPIHSCMTAICMKSYTTFDGQQIEHLEGVMI